MGLRATGLNLASPFAISGNSTAGAEIRLPEDTDNGSNYVAVKAPDSLGSNITCTLPTETSTLGYLNVPVNEQSANYTLVIGDAGKTISHPSTDANARTFTIPANGSVAFPVGTVVSFLNMTSQVVTIAITTDTLYQASSGSTGSRSLAQYGIATAIKMTSTTWLISGNGLT